MYKSEIWKKVLLFSVVLVVCLYAIYQAGRSEEDDSIHIALVGPMSGESALVGKSLLQSVNLYLDTINQQGGINGKKVVLDVFDDKNDPVRAKERAIEIVEQNRAVAVIGHYFSSCSLSGGRVYERYGIPAISGSSTADGVTEGNDWYFRVIFSNRSQAIFLANYVNRIMKQETVSIIHDQDSYGTSLAEVFESTFRGLGGEVKYKWSFEAGAENLDERLDEITGDLLKARTDDPGMILIATHAPEAVKLITAMRRKGMQYPIIGADALGDQKFSARFNSYPEEQAMPGYFSDGIYATSPIIFDVASEKAQQFSNEFVTKYGEEPSWTAATYYDAALVAVEAIRKTGTQGQRENLAEERQKIRDYLAASDSMEKAVVEGVTGRIYFDKHGNVLTPVAIGIFAQKRFISALTQLQPVADLNRIADLDKELEEGRVLIVDGKYMYKTDVVYTGMDINEVSNIDTKNSSYTMDFYLWFRYQGQLEDNNIEFANSVKPLELGEPIAEETQDSITYRAYRVKADFKGDFLFYDYPFDEQQLVIKFRHANLTRDNLIYVVDLVGMRQTSSEAILKKFARAGVFDSVADWRANGVSFFQDIMRSDSTLGNPQFFGSDTDIEYSRFNASIEIRRDIASFGIKNLLVLFIIIGLSYLVFFLPPSQLVTVRTVLTSALLTVAFFHLKLSSDLPGIGYTVALDYVFYTIYALIVFGILLVIIGYREEEKENKIGVWRTLLVGRVFYPIIILISGVLFAYHYDIVQLSPAAATPTPEPVTMAAAELTTPYMESGGGEASDQEVILTLGSWRTDDTEQINRILAVFNAQYPHITVKFDPTTATEYNSVLQTQLEHGIAPDLFYLRSFAGSRDLFEAGYLESLKDLPGLQENFAAEARAPWATDDGELYGVPFIATSHGIYYNIDLFKQLDLEIPTTWEELLATAQALKDAGHVPFANASGDKWTIAEIVFMNLAPNFVGGREGRLKYLTGERCFDDEHVVAAFQAVADIAPFLPADQETLTYYDSQLLFLRGEAAMWMGGSWDIPYFEAEKPGFEWSVFAVPAPAGQPRYVTFHPDVAIGLNAASKHKEEAKLFLEWLTTPKAAELLSNELPGFFPLQTEVPTISNEHADTFLALNWGRGTDVRWAWPMLMDGLPDGYSLMQKGAVAVIRGEMAPQEAADALQSGLGQWFEPAQQCRMISGVVQPTPTPTPKPTAIPQAPATAAAAPKEPTPSAAGPVTIEVWDFQQSDKDILEAQQKAIAEFEKENPGIKVNARVFPYPEYRGELLSALQRGAPPDVSTLDQIWMAEWAASGAIIPLDDYIAGSDVRRGDFFPGSWSSNVWNGKTWGIPLNNGVWQELYYNKDMFKAAGLDPEKPPTTWDELLKAAEKLYNPPEHYGVAIMGTGEFIVCIMDSFIYSNGGKIISKDGTKATINSPEAVEALTYLKQLETFAPPGTASRDEAEAISLFTSGQVAMILAGSWQQDTFKGESDLNWEVAMMPAPEGKTLHATMGGWNLAIYAASRHKEAAWKYVEFLTARKDVQKAVNSLIPARLDAGEEFINELRVGPQIIFDTVNDGYPRPLSEDYFDISKAQVDMIQEIWAGVDVREAVDKAARTIDEILARK